MSGSGDAAAWTRRRLLAAGGLSALALAAGPLGRAAAKERAAGEIRYVDGLSFLPADPALIEASQLAACIADVSGGEPVRTASGEVVFRRTFFACDKSLDQAHRHLAADMAGAYLATHGSEVARREGTGVFLQFQSCEPIEGRLERIAHFHGKGLRLLQITHNHDNLFGGGALEPVPSGLTALGIEGVGEMNRLGMIADVAHASEPTAIDVARYRKGPLIISHGACRAIVDSPRCASDAMIRAAADSGGVMGIFMMSFWLTTAATPTVEHYIAQLRHLIEIGGIEAAGIANDYGMAGVPQARELGNARGAERSHEWWLSMRKRGVPGFETLPAHVVIPELNNIDRMRLIHEALEANRFKSSEIEKIMGGNWLRVLTEALG